MIDAIIQRLEQQCPTLKTVEGAVDLSNLMGSQFAVIFETRPAAFVMFGGDNAGKNEMGTDEVVQVLTETATIAICVGDGKTGAKQVAEDAIMTVRNAVLVCLLGFVPEAQRGALQYRGAMPLAMQPRTIWFAMSFARSYGVNG